MKARESIFSKIYEAPPMLQQNYFPSLDGLRAVSIAIVILAHLNEHFFNNHVLKILVGQGLLGVTIFFVISGFLITSLLLKEQIKTGTISLKNFYLRRFFRIFPLVILYVVCLICLNYFFHLEIHFITFIGCAFFLANLNFFNRSAFAGHFWSLAFEEQYYLIFPFLLKKMYKFFIGLVLSATVFFPVLIVVAGYFQITVNQKIIHVFHFLAQFIPLLIGTLLALLAFKNYFLNSWMQKKGLVINTLLLLLIFWLNIDRIENVFEHYILFIKNVFVCFLIAFFIVINLTKENKNSIYFTVLNSKICIKIGVLSYSMYIWQQVFTLFDDKLPQAFTSMPYNLILLLLVSFISYNYYEKYFLTFKNRFK